MIKNWNQKGHGHGLVLKVIQTGQIQIYCSEIYTTNAETLQEIIDYLSAFTPTEDEYEIVTLPNNFGDKITRVYTDNKNNRYHHELVRLNNDTFISPNGDQIDVKIIRSFVMNSKSYKRYKESHGVTLYAREINSKSVTK